MTSLSLAFASALSIVAVDSDSYTQARRMTVQTGQPMVIVVGAVWCPACEQMKKTVIPEIKERGVLENVSFALVDYDQEPKLAGQLTRGGPIPQLVMYRKADKTWKVRRLVGAANLDADAVQGFIDVGMKLDEPRRKTGENAQTAETRPARTDKPATSDSLAAKD